MINILINNIRFVNPASLIRALHQIQTYSISIWGTDIAEYGCIAGSMLVDHYIKAPSVDNSDEYLLFMKKLCISNNIQFIIPGSDKDVQFYSKYRKEFDAIIILPEEKAANLFIDKYQASLAVNKMGINIPSVIYNLFEEKKIIFRKKRAVSSEGICIIDLEKEKFIPNLFNANFFLQRYVEGVEYTVDIFADKEGSPKLIIPRKRLQVRNGMSVCCQLHRHNRIIELCKEIYSQYYIPGLSNVQFIDDGKQIYFIELNMRFAGSGICGIVASFNYLQQYLGHFLYDQKLNSLEYYMDKVAWSSIVSRYYEECLYSSDKRLSASRSYVQKDK